MKTIIVFNTKSMRRERKNFKTQKQADQWFETKKSNVSLVCPPTEKNFTYRNEWGTMMHVQKMY